MLKIANIYCLKLQYLTFYSRDHRNPLSFLKDRRMPLAFFQPGVFTVLSVDCPSMFDRFYGFSRPETTNQRKRILDILLHSKERGNSI